ncbi:MAG: hypothetical protein V6Z86_05930 [Hyphomicrobiales bacterium]
MDDYEAISRATEIIACLCIKEIAATPCLCERIDVIAAMARTHDLIAQKLAVQLIDAHYAYHDLVAMQAEGES